MFSPDPFAAKIVQAYRQGDTFHAHPDDGPMDIDAAYAVQQAVWRAMVGDSRPTAWKVAAASREAAPIAAPVFPKRLLIAPGNLSGHLFRYIGVEAEIALRFGQDLPVGATREEIMMAVDRLYVAMELVDTRLADPEAAGPNWRLADSLLNGALVLGDAIPGWRGQEWSERLVRIWADGALLAEGPGRPPLGDIFHCLPAWLAHAGGAQAGDIVTTGAWTGMHLVGKATYLAVEFPDLGRAEVCIC